MVVCFLLDPILGVVYCVLREMGLEHVRDFVCDGWDGGGLFWESLVVKILLA
jgi:hypothetical protein